MTHTRVWKMIPPVRPPAESPDLADWAYLHRSTPDALPAASVAAGLNVTFRARHAGGAGGATASSEYVAFTARPGAYFDKYSCKIGVCGGDGFHKVHSISGRTGKGLCCGCIVYIIDLLFLKLPFGEECAVSLWNK